MGQVRLLGSRDDVAVWARHRARRVACRHVPQVADASGSTYPGSVRRPAWHGVGNGCGDGVVMRAE